MVNLFYNYILYVHCTYMVRMVVIQTDTVYLDYIGTGHKFLSSITIHIQPTSKTNSFWL